jgi:hypothetical protein
MAKAKKNVHCRLHRPLTEEEKDRLRWFLRQQGIHLPDADLVAHIEQRGHKDDCPFRYGFAPLTEYCVNECHLATALQPPK